MNATLYREDDNGEEYAINVAFGIYGTYRPQTFVDPAEYPELEVESAECAETGGDVELTDDEKARLWDIANKAKREAEMDRAADAYDDREYDRLHR